MAIHVTDSYGWCADAHHHLRPRRCMDSNPQLVMRCAGAHYHCRPQQYVDHRRVIRCAGEHHRPRPTPREEACVEMRAYHNTHYVPVHNIAVNPPTGKKRVSRCVHITIHMTCRAQHSGRRETRARRRYTSQIVTDGVPTHTTTFVHAGAWIGTLNLLCGYRRTPSLSFTPVRRQSPSTRYSVCPRTPPPSSMPVHGQ